ncbi:MAG: FAD-dependent oxidoreductase [Chitinophagales bacterium]|nr:FAD-binding oxidoreductase [Chitinophagales bacterium]MDW8273712.1 FAD-dependent oxidoreductase [Chitinophagales bacterium]
MISYWEKTALLESDVIIVGAGITGLSAAISLKEKLPSIDVIVLERGILPSGASTRNAGFACIGSAGEILSDLQHMPEDLVLQLVEMRWKGLQLLRKRLGDSNILYRENGSYELLQPNQMSVADSLPLLNSLLKSVTGRETFKILPTDCLQSFGFNVHSFTGIIQNNCEGELHSGLMMKCLMQFANEKGVRILTGCNVSQYNEVGHGVVVDVASLNADYTYTFKAKKAIICTNAYTGFLFPQAEVEPGRGTIILTCPIKNLPFHGIFHFDEGYYYFRELDGRILFGGGRNEFREEEKTFELSPNPKIVSLLIKILEQDILPGREVKVEDMWSGIMAFGKSKIPNLHWLGKHTFAAYKMGGMGVAIGSLAGDIAADAISKSL